jgi:hypothetical protein
VVVSIVPAVDTVDEVLDILRIQTVILERQHDNTIQLDAVSTYRGIHVLLHDHNHRCP